jgi:hypothetical protein
MNYPNVENILNRLGLWKAVRGVPALAAIVVIFVAVSYVALRGTSTLLGLDRPELYLMTVVIGTVLALIGYFLGNFWDDKVFDPLYGLAGRWLNRETRPLSVFPAGDDLRRARLSAIAKLLPNEPQGKGIYRRAVETARTSKAKWEIIEQPLILSKFLRAFIWPSGLASLALIAFGFWQRNPFSLYLGVLLGVLFVLLFVPYINLRVEHMVQLYRHASRESSSR